jgi:hypothetical protein
LKEKKSSESGGGSEKDLAGFETGLEASRTCAGEQKYRGRVWYGDKKRIGCREVPFIYQWAHINCINPIKYWDQMCH